MEEQRRDLGELRGEEIGDRSFVDPETGRCYQHQLLRAMNVERRDFSREHPAHRMADDVGGRDAEFIHQLVIEQHRVGNVVDIFVAGRVAVAGKLRRVDFEVLAEVLEERLDRHQAARAVHEQQRLAAAAVGMHLEREFSV